jgi:hypothetical protein
MLNTKVKVNFNTDITLDKYRVWNIDGDRRGDMIRCLNGTLWITQEGDMRDYILESGQDFWVTKAGTVILQALENSKFTFSLNELPNHIEVNQQPIQHVNRPSVRQPLR